MTSPDGLGLVTATPLQRAICRMIEGRPLGELAKHPDVIAALNGAKPPIEAPLETVIVSAIRAGKSLIAAGFGIYASQTCDLSILSIGEIPRFSILSIEKDNARQTHQHIVGALQRPELAKLRVSEQQAGRWRELIDESGAETIGSEFLWHPTGRPVEIRVVAGKRAGSSVVSRWSIGGVYDEAPRMVGASDGVVNYDDARKGILGRMLPGGQLLSPGSPWAPFGPIFDVVRKEWGHPRARRLVIKAPGPAMNPIWWTPERCAALKEQDEATYETDCMANFADLEESLFTQAMLDACTRKDPLVVPPEPGHEYEAAMDPATRRNAWTLVVATRTGRKKRIVLAHQWQGTPRKRLRPKQVLREAAELLRPYGIDSAITDQWSADALQDIAEDLGEDARGKKLELRLIEEPWNAENKTQAFLGLEKEASEGYIELPPDPYVHKDLTVVRRRPTQNGVTIVLPVTPDGRHADYAPVIAKVLHRWLAEETEQPPPAGTPEHSKWVEKQMIAREIEKLEEQQDRPWWDQSY